WSPLHRIRRPDGCRYRTGWRVCRPTAATASCPIPITRSSRIGPPPKRQSTRSVTLCMRCASTRLWTHRCRRSDQGVGGSDNMKAIVRETYGPPDVLHLEEVPLPTVRDGDVLVRVRAASA